MVCSAVFKPLRGRELFSGLGYSRGCRPNREPGSYEREITVKAREINTKYL